MSEPAATAGQATPIRVLHVINGLGTGGAERSVAELVVPLAERGVELRFATFYDRDEGIQHERDDLVADRIEASGPLARSRAVRAASRAWRADVVHATLFEADVAARLARQRGVPLVSSLVNTSYGADRARHDPNVRRWRLQATRLVDLVTARVVTRFHAITEAVADAATRDLLIHRARITVVPRGRDRARLGEPTAERRAAARARLGIGDRPLVLNVARQEYQKGQADLVAAFAEVRRQVPGAVLAIAGRAGSASADLRRQVDELDVGRDVLLLGHRTDIGDLLVAADVFAFPSRYEGLGGSVLEAMALGCPVVASDLPAIREVTAGTAHLVAPGEPAALARAVLDVLLGAVDPGLAASARRRFDECYSLDRCADMMAAMYRSVLRGAP